MQPKSHQYSVIGAFIDPSKDSYCTQKNIPIYDRTSAQKQKIQEIEERNRVKQQADEDERNKERFVLKEFQNVKPRVWQAVEEAKSENPHPYKRKDAGAAISNIQVPKPMEVEQEPEQRKQVAARVNSQNPSYNPSAQQKNVNYIHQNIANMREADRKNIDEKNKPKVVQKEKLGEVPEYLQKRKQQWLDEREKDEMSKRLDEELAKIPPGTRPVGDEERAKLLAELKVALTAEQKKYNSFRMQADGYAAQKAKQECMDKMTQLEKTIRDFERPGPLYIAIE